MAAANTPSASSLAFTLIMNKMGHRMFGPHFSSWKLTTMLSLVCIYRLMSIIG